MTAPKQKFEQPQVNRKWLTSSTARAAYTYTPKASKLPAIGATDGQGDEAIAYVKLFSPTSGWTWYLTEANRETGEAYGLVAGHEVEQGYIDLNEMTQPVGGFIRLPVERDIHWTPQPLSAIRRKHER